MTGAPTPKFDPGTHFADKKARVYDRHVRQVVPGYDVVHQLARLHMATNAPHDAHILVIGAGSGMEILALSKGFANRTFTAVDPAAEMLARAREKVAGAGLLDRVTFHQGYLHELDEAQRFDAATVMLVLQFVADDATQAGGGKAGLLNQMSARLKPQSPVVIVDALGKPGTRGFDQLKALWEARRIDEGMPEDEQKMSAEHIERNFRWISEGRFFELVEGAGLSRPQLFWRGLLFSGWLTTSPP